MLESVAKGGLLVNTTQNIADGGSDLLLVNAKGDH